MRIAVHDYAGHPFQVDLSRELARRGHTVWHLYFADDQGPKGTMERLSSDPITFEIVPVSTGRHQSRSNLFSRRANDVHYGRAVAAHIRVLKPDVVLSGNTPLDAQGAIQEATHGVGGAFVNWIQDLYGLAIERLLAQKWFGLGALVGSYYTWMDRRQLIKSDAVVLISEDFRKNLAGFENRPDRVAVIPNWGAIDGIPLRPKSNPWSRRHNLVDRFVFLYSGTLGLKHDPDALIALADAFADRPEVTIVVTASGVGRDRLALSVIERPRPNLALLPLQPFSEFPDVLGTADVLIAVLEKEAGEFSVPSKILSYLCAGRPILLSAPLANLASRIVQEIHAGTVVRSGNLAGLVDAAEKLYQDKTTRENMALSGRAYAEETFVIDRVADRFEAVMRAARQGFCEVGDTGGTTRYDDIAEP